MTYDPIDTNDDGIVDADVDSESVKTDDATVNNSLTYPDGSSTTSSPTQEEWDEIDRTSGLNKTLSLNASVTGYDYYRVSFLVDPADTGYPITVTVNGTGGSAYDYLYQSSAGVGTTTGDAQWTVIDDPGDFATYNGQYIIGNGTRHQIFGNTSARSLSAQVLQRGFVNDTNNISSIKVETGGDVGGAITSVISVSGRSL